jgi:hypothetical protein
MKTSFCRVPNDRGEGDWVFIERATCVDSGGTVVKRDAESGNTRFLYLRITFINLRLITECGPAGLYNSYLKH